MNFALYSSDWTKLNIKYKKMILLIMRMNSAEKMKLKVSLKKIVNLEMFASVCIIFNPIHFYISLRFEKKIAL